MMYQNIFKRIIDLVITIIALPFWLLLLSVIAPLVYIEDKGSIFYNSKRLGKDGKLFTMYKLRSMKENAPDVRNEDGSTYNAEDDPRLTKMGKLIRKTSIDEIPQLLNVLKGDMSLIGPRPAILTSDFSKVQGVRRKRYEVKPGITGYTQAYYRNSISQKEKFEYDAEYVKKISLVLDIKIFFKTIITVLFGTNIYTNTLDKKDIE